MAASISAIGCSPFSAPFRRALSASCAAARCQSRALDQPGRRRATARPPSRTLTSYYVKLCGRACVDVQTVVAVSLGDCSTFACGFLRLGFGYCCLTTALTLLYAFSPCLPATLFSARKTGKKKVLCWSVQAVFLNSLWVSQWATCLASPDV